MKKITTKKLAIALFIIFLAFVVWSAIKPRGYFLWFMEMAPAFIGIATLYFFRNTIVFSKTTYIWCFIGAVMISIGAHYGFSNVPLFNWIKDYFGWDRNNYDKLGHIIQGVIPVLISQEVYHEKGIIKSKFWMNFHAISIAISVATFYELLEWGFFIWKNDTTHNFLGTQGYIWDAQSDIFFAIIGAVITVLLRRKASSIGSKGSHEIVVGNK